MSMVLVGSRALSIRQPEALNRKPLDFDWICTKEEYDAWLAKNLNKCQTPEKPAKVYELPEYNKWIIEGNSICEFDIIQNGSSNELLVELVKNDPKTIETPFGLIPSLDLLYATKRAHQYKKFHDDCRGFYKTRIDIEMMKAYGAEIKPEHEVYFKLREQETYAKTHLPKLNMGKNTFFNAEETYFKYDHDDTHRAVAVGEKPAYEYYLADNSPVMTSNKKFFACSEFIRLCGVLEEALVLSLERSQIPNNYEPNPDASFKFALAKVCTTITGGKFREYAADNIFKVLKMYPEYGSGYVKKFQYAVKNGKVALLKK